MKKILIVPGNLFVSRNYFSSPLIEKLFQMSIKERLTIYIAGLEGNPVSENLLEKLTPFFEDNYNIKLIPLMKKLVSPKERLLWFLKNNYLHRASIYRFNEINNFETHQRFKKITKTYAKRKDDHLWRSDIWPSYLGFPFPKSKFLLKILKKLLNSKYTSSNSIIEGYFKDIKPDLLIIGDIQAPISFNYTAVARKNRVKVAGNVRTWDHLTKNGPVVENLDEYWVWNKVMKEELKLLHGIPYKNIFEVGSPQFDYYSFKKEQEIDDLINYYQIQNPLNFLNILSNTKVIFFATNRPHRGIGEESIVEHICENIALGNYLKEKIYLILRSHPYDETFKSRFKQFSDYPFVNLLDSPNLSRFNPKEFRKDMIRVSILLRESSLVICGQSTFVIDASCANVPIINIAFDGKEEINETLSVKNRYNVDHYQKLLSMNGTTVVADFDLLDKSIIEYLLNPEIKSDGRKMIQNNFAGVTSKQSSDKILDRILDLLKAGYGGNGRN